MIEISAPVTKCGDCSQIPAVIAQTLITPKCHHLMLFPFELPSMPFCLVVCCIHPFIMKEQEMLRLVFFELFQKVYSVPVVSARRFLFVFAFPFSDDLVKANLKTGSFLRIYGFLFSNGIPVVDHFLQKFPHLCMPLIIRFILRSAL